MHRERINEHVPYEYTKNLQRKENEGEKKKAEQVRGQRKDWQLQRASKLSIHRDFPFLGTHSDTPRNLPFPAGSVPTAYLQRRLRKLDVPYRQSGCKEQHALPPTNIY